jgi:hypothetical protein
MSGFPPIWTLYPPIDVIAALPQWVFQTIDLPKDPTSYPWSLFCRIIEVTKNESIGHVEVESTRALAEANGGFTRTDGHK